MKFPVDLELRVLVGFCRHFFQNSYSPPLFSVDRLVLCVNYLVRSFYFRFLVWVSLTVGEYSASIFGVEKKINWLTFVVYANL